MRATAPAAVRFPDDVTHAAKDLTPLGRQP